MNAAASSMTANPPAPASRRLIVTGFILSTLFTTVLGSVSSCVLSERQTTRAEKITEVNRFLRTTEEFEPLMRQHVRNLVRGRSLEASREALKQNIQSQHVVLRSVRAYVPEHLRSQADSYGSTLVKVAGELDVATGPLTAGPLMQQVNDAVVAKQKLMAALREGVGLTS